MTPFMRPVIRRNTTTKRFLSPGFWLTIICLFLSAGHVSAQSIVHRMYLYDMGVVMTAAVGPTVSFTDIKTLAVFPAIKPINEIGFTIQGTLIWDINSYFAMGGQLAYATISGARSNQRFDAQLFEGNLSINFNLIRLFWRYRSDQKWDPYIIVGVGLSNYNSTLKFINTGKVRAKRGYGSGGGPLGSVIEGVAIIGAGVKFKLNDHWFLRFESANRWMNDDKLDTFESIKSSPYDFYNLTTIGISYKIFRHHHYPMIRQQK